MDLTEINEYLDNRVSVAVLEQLEITWDELYKLLEAHERAERDAIRSAKLPDCMPRAMLKKIEQSKHHKARAKELQAVINRHEEEED